MYNSSTNSSQHRMMSNLEQEDLNVEEVNIGLVTPNYTILYNTSD